MLHFSGEAGILVPVGLHGGEDWIRYTFIAPDIGSGYMEAVVGTSRVGSAVGLGFACTFCSMSRSRHCSPGAWDSCWSLHYWGPVTFAHPMSGMGLCATRFSIRFASGPTVDGKASCPNPWAKGF